ncbi:helix-turn-helix domain-containing protein [Flavitalea sp. BT771]|uniref:winged helix-turn-helix transcriptional regulator n=1 Tax=Flavitalea sp. BT771 TaxID=3063329 RepID=UPI0026E2BFFC|nr:helix-turn-helix domain-containing protein [Flavitalea sp. BT771]MDO6432619.1 helix-turn-helix domain-containing protein [Flavitalea sp. BT771]MDV6222105.1 helix-turn-helix domain-containing protein [Flavitalea sp. BT771]
MVAANLDTFTIQMILLPVWKALSNLEVMQKLKVMLSKAGCPKTMLSIKDALEALEGRWKLLILFSLAEKPKRFKQIAKEVSGITDKTLSKELKSLEANKLVRRDVYDTFPPTVEYSITPHGLSLEKLLDELHLWGLVHRKKVIGK